MKLIKHEAPEPVDKIGDTLRPLEGWKNKLTSTGGGWFSAPLQEVWESKPLIDLTLLMHHPWKALKVAGIDDAGLQEAVTYECPYTDNRYFWFLPLYIFTDDVPGWVDRIGGDKFLFGSKYVKNVDWQRKVFNDAREADYMDRETVDFPNEFPLSQIDKAMLGHGYTTGTRPGDGHGELLPCTVALEGTKDYVGGSVWVWYNK